MNYRMKEEPDQKPPFDWVRLLVNLAIAIPLVGIAYIRLFTNYRSGWHLYRWIVFILIVGLVIFYLYRTYKNDSIYRR